jgi:hypothetical protein
MNQVHFTGQAEAQRMQRNKTRCMMQDSRSEYLKSLNNPNVKNAKLNHEARNKSE